MKPDEINRLKKQNKRLIFELSKYKRALRVAKERICRHWSGNSEDTCVEIAHIIQKDYPK